MSDEAWKIVERAEREWEGMRQARDEAIAERDRLRAVVEAAHELLDEDRTSWSPEHARLAEALAALDGTGVIGGPPVFTQEGYPVPEPEAEAVRQIARGLGVIGDEDDATDGWHPTLDPPLGVGPIYRDPGYRDAMGADQDEGEAT